MPELEPSKPGAFFVDFLFISFHFIFDSRTAKQKMKQSKMKWTKSHQKMPQVWKAPVLAFYVLMFFFGIFAGVGGSQNIKWYSWLIKDKRTFLGWQHLFLFTLKIIRIISIRKHICVCVHRGGAWSDYVLLGVLHDRVQCHQSSHVSFYHQPSILHDRV